MKFLKKGKRILALVLAFVLIASNLPLSTPIFAVDDATNSEESPDLHKFVKINSNFSRTVYLVPGDSANQVFYSSTYFPKVMEIAAVKEVGGDTYYQVIAALGFDWSPSATYTEHNANIWIKSNEVDFVEPCAKCKQYGCESDHANWCDICQKDDCGANHVSAPVLDSEGNEVKGSDGQPLKVTVTGDLPTGATVSATIPSINGEMLPNVYDIKVLLPDGTEWQPIDDGKSVMVTIPVHDSRLLAVDVYHAVDYKKAFSNPGIHYVSLEGATEKDLPYFSDAILASDKEGYIAIETFDEQEVFDGMVNVYCNSFSVFYYGGGQYGDSDGNTTRINFEPTNEDNGKYYFVTRGTEIIAAKGLGALSFSSWNYSSEIFEMKKDGYTDYNVTFTVRDHAAVYGIYDIKLGSQTTIHFVVMPELTLKFDHNINRDVSITLPAERGGIFMGTYNGVFPEDIDTQKEYFKDRKYPALNQTLNIPTINDQYKDAYQFEYWYVQHNPDKKFVFEQGATSSTIWLSNSTLEVNMNDETVSNYDVTLVAKFKPVDFNITFNTDGGNLPTGVANSQTYTIDDVFTLPTPTKTDHVFLGWKVTSAAGNWTANTIISGDSSVHDMYGNVTLTAQWAEISDATYRVEHYLQDTSLSTNRDTYILTYTDTLAGKPPHLTEATAKNLRGFSALSFEQVEITEDNQTVVKIYYDRITYTISFDTNGGTSVAPITQAYGTTVAAPASPSKEGYVFKGWYAANAPTEMYNFTTMPAENLTLFAKWEAKKNTITIMNVIDGVVSGVLDTINQDSNSALTTPANPVKVGYIFGGWYKDAACTQEYTFPTEMPTDENTNVYAKWTSIQYTINFNLNGGGSLPNDFSNPLTFAITTAPSALPIPVREGYTFQGWYADATCTGEAYTWQSLAAELLAINEATVTKNLYAKWEINTYTITFNSNGGPAVNQITQNYGTAVYPPQPPVWNGYNFLGWYSDAALTQKYEFSTMPAENITLYAKWEINTYTITWQDDTGKVLGTSQVQYGSVPVFNGTPSKETTAQYTYTFAGWQDANGNVYAGTLPAVTGDATYTATFSSTVRTYTVTWKNWDGTVLETDTGVPYGTMPSYNGSAPTKPSDVQYSYTFSHWSTEVTAVTGDAIYTATFTPVDNYYTITWVDGNGNTLLTEEVKYGVTPSYTGSLPQKDATAEYTYTFSGNWSPAIELVQGDATYTAQFTSTKNKYTVTWKNWDGSVIYSEKLEYGMLPSYIGSVPMKVRTGYTCTFTGWSPEISTVTGEVSYVAQFTETINQYTVTIVFGNGTENLVIKQNYGTTITVPADPTKTGYTFTGWDKTIPSTMPAENLTITATWKINQYTITFNSNGGPAVNSITENYGTVVTEPQAPVRHGYNFLGWYTDTQLTQKYTFSTMPAENITLYAKWERSLTTLTITVNGWQSIDAHQSFLFDIAGKDANVTVTVHENGSVTIEGLTIGSTYTVTMQHDWSWRYKVAQDNDNRYLVECENVSDTEIKSAASNQDFVFEFTLGVDGILTFNVDRDKNQWLDGNFWAELFSTPNS